MTKQRSSSTRARRSVALVSTFACLAVLSSGCASEGDTRRLNLADLPSVGRTIQCDTIDVLEADMAFYDDMRGFNCFYPNGETVLFRAYERNESILQVLPGLEPTIGAQNQVVIGSNWFATGSPAKLQEVARVFHGSPSESRLVIPSGAPLSAEQEALGACSSYVTSAIHAQTLEPEGASAVIDGSEATYPGLADLAADAAKKLSGQGVTEDNFDSLVTTQAVTVRAFCANLYR